jgi:hypothetical protein
MAKVEAKTNVVTVVVTAELEVQDCEDMLNATESVEEALESLRSVGKATATIQGNVTFDVSKKL